METLKTIWDFLSGKKTYIAGGLMIVLGLIQNDTQMILEGIGLLTLRQSVATLGSNLGLKK